MKKAPGGPGVLSFVEKAGVRLVPLIYLVLAIVLGLGLLLGLVGLLGFVCLVGLLALGGLVALALLSALGGLVLLLNLGRAPCAAGGLGGFFHGVEALLLGLGSAAGGAGLG